MIRKCQGATFEGEGTRTCLEVKTWSQKFGSCGVSLLGGSVLVQEQYAVVAYRWGSLATAFACSKT